MKRNVHLQPFSREHHRALVCWRDLDRQLGGADGTKMRIAARALSDYGAERFLGHMAVEETLLVDLLSDELRSRLLADHQALRSLLNSIRQQLDTAAVEVSELAELASIWRAHIRWEERHLFPYLETHAPPSRLQFIGDRLRQNVHGGACSTPQSKVDARKDG